MTKKELIKALHILHKNHISDLNWSEENIKSIANSIMNEMTKPETKPIIIENDNKPCINYRNQESGWTCRIYAVRCDGISCKEDCEWYNKSSLYTSK